MSVCMTISEAMEKRLCPNAAIIGTDKTRKAFCHGSACGAWRWAADGRFREIVAKVAAETDEKEPFKNASAKVAAKPVSYGLNGYCGLGGAP